MARSSIFDWVRNLLNGLLACFDFVDKANKECKKCTSKYKEFEL